MVIRSALYHHPRLPPIDRHKLERDSQPGLTPGVPLALSLVLEIERH